jgi:pimeloyl-ACP methyl ester carboxylesterase
MGGQFGLHKDGVHPFEHSGTAEHVAPELPFWAEAFAGLEWLSLRTSAVYRMRGIAAGDGSAVVLIPGLLASDASMYELERWLRRLGYRPYLSGIGRNARCPELSLAGVVRTVDRAYDETGRRVHIVGHSLGGLLARGAAVVRPRQVQQVITLATPVNGARVHPIIAFAAEAVRGECDGECLAALQQALPSGVRETNVYSRTDGVVDWRTCIRDGATRVEVPGTHVGLIVNRHVYEELAGLLAPAVQSPPMRLRPPAAVARELALAA